jgi:hypothetical protein
MTFAWLEQLLKVEDPAIRESTDLFFVTVNKIRNNYFGFNHAQCNFLYDLLK